MVQGGLVVQEDCKRAAKALVRLMHMWLKYSLGG